MVDVTIPDEETSVEFDASSVGPHFFLFTYFAKADLHVSIDGVELGQGDFIHTPNTALEGGYDGGSITLNTAVPGGAGRLWRVTETVRTDNYTAGPLPPPSISRDMNKIVAMAQDARRDIDGLAAVDAEIRDELATEAAEIRAEMAAADADVRADMAAADTGLHNEIVAGDAALHSEIIAGDAVLHAEIVALEAELRGEYTTADAALASDIAAVAASIAAGDAALAADIAAVAASIAAGDAALAADIVAGDAALAADIVAGDATLDAKIDALETELRGEYTETDEAFQEDLDTAVRAPVGETLGRMPAAAARVGKALVFDGSGQPTVADFVSSTITVHATWQAALLVPLAAAVATFLAAADQPGMHTALGIHSSWSAPLAAPVSSNVASLLGAADYAAIRSQLSLGTAALANTGTSGATVPLLNAANVWSAPQTFPSSTVAGTLTLADATPQLFLQETDASANNKNWRILAAAEDLYFGAVNDALSAAGYFMLVSRTGITIDAIALAATALTFNGSQVMTLAANETVTGAKTFSLDGVTAFNRAAATNSEYILGLYGNGTIRGYIGANASKYFIASNAGGSEAFSVGNAGVLVPIGLLHISGASAPRVAITETDAAADSGKVWLYQETNQFALALINDAENNSSPVILISRSGITPTSIALTATALTWNANTVLTTATGAQLTAANAFSGGVQNAIGAGTQAWRVTSTSGSGDAWLYASTNILVIGAISNHPLIIQGNSQSECAQAISGDFRLTGAPTALATTSAGFRGIPINFQNGNYTLVLSDAGKTITHNPGSGSHALTIPPSSSVAWPDGTTICIDNFSGSFVITPGSGVTLYWLNGAGTYNPATLTIAAGNSVSLTYISNNNWIVRGQGT